MHNILSELFLISPCMLLSPGGGGWPDLPADEGGVSHLQECASGVVPREAEPGHLACLNAWTGEVILLLTTCLYCAGGQPAWTDAVGHNHMIEMKLHSLC